MCFIRSFKSHNLAVGCFFFSFFSLIDTILFVAVLNVFSFYRSSIVRVFIVGEILWSKRRVLQPESQEPVLSFCLWL